MASPKDSTLAFESAAARVIMSAERSKPAAPVPKAVVTDTSTSAAVCRDVVPDVEKLSTVPVTASILFASNPARLKVLIASAISNGPRGPLCPSLISSAVRSPILLVEFSPSAATISSVCATSIPCLAVCMKPLEIAAPPNRGARLPHVSHSRLKPEASPRMAEWVSLPSIARPLSALLSRVPLSANFLLDTVAASAASRNCSIALISPLSVY